MQSGKGKTGFLRTFPGIPAVFTQIETTFQSIEIFTCEKEKLCPKTAVLWLTRVAYLPTRVSSPENIAVLEAIEKAKSKE